MEVLLCGALQVWMEGLHPCGALQEGFVEEVAFVKPSANVVSFRAKDLKTKPRKPKQAT